MLSQQTPVLTLDQQSAAEIASSAGNSASLQQVPSTEFLNSKGYATVVSAFTEALEKQAVDGSRITVTITETAASNIRYTISPTFEMKIYWKYRKLECKLKQSSCY